MADVSQIETSFSFESRTAPVNPAGPNRTQDTGGNAASHSSEAAPVSRGDDAFDVALSKEAQRASSSGTEEPSVPDATFETSANRAEESKDASTETNQVTSFKNERTGNDTSHTTEAGRTLGQVIDTFA